MIKATLTGGDYEPPRNTFTMGSAACESCGSRKPHEHLAPQQSQRAATGWDDSPPVRQAREYSRPDYGSAMGRPWHEAYGNGGKYT
jgi:hypothetical protein